MSDIGMGINGRSRGQRSAGWGERDDMGMDDHEDLDDMGARNRSLMNESARDIIYREMSREGSRRENRRRDADDFDPEAKIMRKLFVNKIPATSNEAEVRDYFEMFGPVESCDIAKHKGDKGQFKKGESRGFCFIVYEKSLGLEACQAAKPHYFGGSELSTKRATLVEDKLC